MPTDNSANVSERATKAARINVRLANSQASLIKRAADLQDKTITDFVLSSAAVAAEQVLADRRWFSLDDSAWQSFDAMLDRPAIFKPRLNALLNSDDEFVD